MSCRSRKACSSICAAVMALTDKGTSWIKSSRLRAVNDHLLDHVVQAQLVDLLRQCARAKANARQRRPRRQNERASMAPCGPFVSCLAYSCVRPSASVVSAVLFLQPRQRPAADWSADERSDGLDHAEQGRRIDSSVQAGLMQQAHQILRRQVARRARREWTSSQTANRRVENCECRIRRLARRWPAPRRGCRAGAPPSSLARRTSPSGRTTPWRASDCRRRSCRRR